MPQLLPLPAQPAGVPWPTQQWPETSLASVANAPRVNAAAEVVFRDPTPETYGETQALLVVQGGRLAFERYAAGKSPTETFVSWSMAKSITHALVGVLVGDGKLALDAPAPLAEWRESKDPRSGITLEHMLRMVDGLDFVEVYEEAGRSDVVEMLFRSGREDVAAYARQRPSAHPPGSYWNYSSGTTNVVAAIVSSVLGGGREGMEAFMRRALFDRIGMTSAKPRFDPAGTFIGSSYVFATARDFARFGLLYLRDGIWDGERVLPEGWVDHGRTETPASFGQYGAHWWLARDGTGIFSANGLNGQYTVVVPSRDLVLVRLGISSPDQRVHVVHGLKEIVESFPLVGEAPQS